MMTDISPDFQPLRFCLLNVGESQALAVLMQSSPSHLPQHLSTNGFCINSPAPPVENFLSVSFVLGGAGGLTDLLFLVARRKR